MGYWPFWLRFHKVTLWQACALSVGLDPDCLHPRDPSWWNVRSPKDFDGFASEVKREQFEKRLRLAVANLSDSEYFRMAVRKKIRLSEFASWSVNQMRWRLPSQLKELAQTAPTKGESSPLAEPSTTLLTEGPAGSVNVPPSPLQRQRWQEQEIVQAIRGLGYDPTALPRQQKGKPGIKAAVRFKLKGARWPGTTFDKAWERLRQQGEIADAK